MVSGEGEGRRGRPVYGVVKCKIPSTGHDWIACSL